MSEFWKSELAIEQARFRELREILANTHRRESGERAMLRRSLVRTANKMDQIENMIERVES